MHIHNTEYRTLRYLAPFVAAAGLFACGSSDNNSGANSASGGAADLGGNGGTNTTSSNAGGAANTNNGGSGQGGTGTGGGATTTKAAPIGTFSVVLTPANADTGTEAFAKLNGIVRSAAMPDPKIWTLSAEKDGCQLVIPSAPLCDPKCATGETCVSGGKCVAAPTPKSVGTVNVKGVKTTTGATAFSIEPNTNKSYVPDADIAFPPFEEGALVEVSASGGDYAALTLSAKGINVLAGLPKSIQIATGNAATVTWTAAGSSASSTIELSLDISQHGGTKGVINCNVPDTGSFDIPATLITQLISLGVAGFPMISIARRSLGSADLSQGRVDLLLTSASEIPVEIPGLTSCNDEQPCPTGKTCQSDYVCK